MTKRSNIFIKTLFTPFIYHGIYKCFQRINFDQLFGYWVQWVPQDFLSYYFIKVNFWYLKVHLPYFFHILQRYFERVTGVLWDRCKILLSSRAQILSNFINSRHFHVLPSMLSSQETVVSFVIKGTTFARKFHTKIVCKSFVISWSLFRFKVFKSFYRSSLSLMLMFKYLHFF